jgi:hypothetical protein
MPHSKFLRAIGDSLQFLGVVNFVIEKAGSSFVVRSAEPVDPARLIKPNVSERVWETQTSSRRHAKLFREDGALHYEDSYVSWLDAQGKRKRRKRFSAQASGTKNLPQLLRTLGRHLDRVEPHAFRVSWGEKEVHIDYQLADGTRGQEILSIAKLRELTVRSRFRRAPRK